MIPAALPPAGLGNTPPAVFRPRPRVLRHGGGRSVRPSTPSRHNGMAPLHARSVRPGVVRRSGLWYNETTIRILGGES